MPTVSSSDLGVFIYIIYLFSKKAISFRFFLKKAENITEQIKGPLPEKAVGFLCYTVLSVLSCSCCL